MPLQITRFKITFDTLKPPNVPRLPTVVQEEVLRLHALAQTKPENAIPQLLDAIKKHPRVPQFWNYLIVAHRHLHNEEEACRLAEECFRLFPDYVIGMLAYLEILVRLKEYKTAKKLSNNFDQLPNLFPKRTEFHISEVVSYTAVGVMYFAEIGEKSVAKSWYDMLVKVAPDSPITRQARQYL